MKERNTDRSGRSLLAMRLRPLASVAAVAVLSLAASGCNKFEAKQRIRDGNAHFKEQQYTEALASYEEALRLDPSESRIHKFIAMANMGLYNPGSQHEKDKKAYEDAVTHFKTYLQAKPDDEKAGQYLVTTYMNAQKYDDAIGYFRDFFAKHPTDVKAVQTIAMLYAKQGNFDESIAWQKRRSEIETTNPEVFYTMGVTCWDKSYHTVGVDIAADTGLTPEKRKEILDFGTAQLQKAIQLKPDYYESMLYVNLMYREYAKMEPDPVKKQALVDTATEWQKKALEIRKIAEKKRREEQAAKNPLEAL